MRNVNLPKYNYSTFNRKREHMVTCVENTFLQDVKVAFKLYLHTYKGIVKTVKRQLLTINAQNIEVNIITRTKVL